MVDVPGSPERVARDELCGSRVPGKLKPLSPTTRKGTLVTVPLYQAKAEMFRTLGHPIRIRVLELLQAGPQPVRDLLAEIDVEPSNLSQQLAVLRRAGIVVSVREGGQVSYALSTPAVAELLAAGRRILREVLTDRDGLLAQLQAGGAGD